MKRDMGLLVALRVTLATVDNRRKLLSIDKCGVPRWLLTAKGILCAVHQAKIQDLSAKKT